MQLCLQRSLQCEKSYYWFPTDLIEPTKLILYDLSARDKRIQKFSLLPVGRKAMENMQDKAQMSVKTKKTLLILGIIFGTIFLFIVSFGLSVYYIINPVKVVGPDNGEVAAENQELKIKIQALEDEIEHLSASADKNHSNINPPAPVEIPTVTTPDREEKPVEDKQKNGVEDAHTDEDDDFSPNTVITPDGGYEPEPEGDITIIDITE